MVKKSILFVVLFIGLQSGISFSAQQPSQNKSSWIPAWVSSWWNKTPQQKWAEQQQAQQQVAEQNKLFRATPFASSIVQGTLMGLITAQYTALLECVLGSNVFSLRTAFVNVLPGGMINFARLGEFTALGVGMGTLGTIATYVGIQIGKRYFAGEINKTEAVQRVKDLIFTQLCDSLMYPTRSSKINALVKKEFLFSRNLVSDIQQQDLSDIVKLACDSLLEDIARLPKEKTVQEQANPMIQSDAIDKAISVENAQLLQYPEFEDKMNQLKTDPEVGQLLQLLQNPKLRAKLSILMRLENQQLFEQTVRTSSTGGVRRALADEYRQQLASKELGESIQKRQMTEEERADYLKKLKKQQPLKRKIGESYEEWLLRLGTIEPSKAKGISSKFMYDTIENGVKKFFAAIKNGYYGPDYAQKLLAIDKEFEGNEFGYKKYVLYQLIEMIRMDGQSHFRYLPNRDPKWESTPARFIDQTKRMIQVVYHTQVLKQPRNTLELGLLPEFNSTLAQ